MEVTYLEVIIILICADLILAILLLVLFSKYKSNKKENIKLDTGDGFYINEDRDVLKEESKNKKKMLDTKTEILFDIDSIPLTKEDIIKKIPVKKKKIAFIGEIQPGKRKEAKRENGSRKKS